MDWTSVAGFVLLALVTFGVLLWPVLRRRREEVDRFEAELALCREQLAEIRRDLELGTITREAARAAELEIKRRMVEIDRERERAGGTLATAGTPARGFAVLTALAVPMVGTLIYLTLGRPDLPDQPLAARTDRNRAVAEGADRPPVAEMVRRLEARIAENPEDVQGQLALARAYMVLERYAEAAQVYARVRELAPDLPGVDSARGEALVLAEQGVVGEAARRAFEAELARQPRDPRARFYLALAAEQAGNDEEALARYLALARESRADAPWLDELRARIRTVAERLGRDPEPLLADLARQDPAAEIAALERRLAEDPKQWQAWIRLAELRAATGNPEGARQALERARELYAGAPFVRRQIDEAARRILGDGATVAQNDAARRGPTAADMEAAASMSPEEQQAMIRQMVARLAERLKDQPDDPEGWRMLARSYRVLGERAKALEAYRTLAQRWPEDVQAQLDYARALLAEVPKGEPLPAEVVQAFERVLALDPEQPDALFFVGLGAVQRDDPVRARELWSRLLPRLPEDSEVRRELERRIRALAENAS